jgi:hypothetical protein
MAVPVTHTEKAPKAERDALEEEIKAFLKVQEAKGITVADRIGWAKLLSGVQKDEFSSDDLQGLRRIMAVYGRPCVLRDEWTWTHPNMLVNDAQRVAYVVFDDSDAHALLCMNLSTGEPTEVVKASQHFTNEEVRAVFRAIVKSKLGNVAEPPMPEK